MDRHDIPSTCTLDVGAARTQAHEWTELLANATGRERTAGGLRLTLPIEHAAQVENLARREAACCSFLAIETRRNATDITLDVTASDEAGRRLVAAFYPGP